MLGIDVGAVHVAACVVDVVPVSGPHVAAPGSCEVCSKLDARPAADPPEELGPLTGGDAWWHVTVRKQHVAVSVVSWRLLNAYERPDAQSACIRTGACRDLARSEDRKEVKDAGASVAVARALAPIIAEWAALRPDVVAVEHQVMSANPKTSGAHAGSGAATKYNERMKVLHGVLHALIDQAMEVPVYDKHGKNTTTMVWDISENAWWNDTDGTKFELTRGCRDIEKSIKKKMAAATVAHCVETFSPGARNAWSQCVWRGNHVRADLADSLLHAVNLAACLKCVPPYFGPDTPLPNMLERTDEGSLQDVRAAKLRHAASYARICALRSDVSAPTWLASEEGVTNASAKHTERARPPPLPPSRTPARKRKRATAASTVESKDMPRVTWTFFSFSSVTGMRSHSGISDDVDMTLRRCNGSVPGGKPCVVAKGPYFLSATVSGFGTNKTAALTFEQDVRRRLSRVRGTERRTAVLFEFVDAWNASDHGCVERLDMLTYAYVPSAPPAAPGPPDPPFPSHEARGDECTDGTDAKMGKLRDEEDVKILLGNE